MGPSFPHPPLRGLAEPPRSLEAPGKVKVPVVQEVESVVDVPVVKHRRWGLGFRV